MDVASCKNRSVCSKNERDQGVNGGHTSIYVSLSTRVLVVAIVGVVS